MNTAVEGHRGRGYALRCALYMIEHLRPVRAVWGADETHLPSLRLAAKLGFVPADEVLVIHPPGAQGAGAALR